MADELDYVYVDVWGNFTSGAEDAWQTRKSPMRLSATTGASSTSGAAPTTGIPPSSTGSADFTLRGKRPEGGQLNSAIMRFMLNSHKDSFVPDFPTYGGCQRPPCWAAR